ncbi:unnamed protein product [Fusarium equiseti]|uniref:F-box domain-containing protein n=1 Tax=Fusarium equiseti TaxID=61235 RepID=A0A8J2IPY4_FUSEQ|nr:unnamed protein product [Fusarium equiseti]
MARKSRKVARGGRGRRSKPSSATLPYVITYMPCGYFCSHCYEEYQLPYGPLLGAEKAQDSGTLYNLCLVSRSWRDVAQQVLYHSFHPDYPPPRKRILKSAENPWKLRLEPFLRTIAARPDLACSIQTVILRDLVIYGLDFYESRRAFDECARALGTSSREIYYKGHHASAPSAIREAFFLGTPISILPDASTLASEIAGELLSALVAFLSQLKQLSIEEEYLWGGWKYNLSPTTLDALGVTSIRSRRSRWSARSTIYSVAALSLTGCLLVG